MIPWCGYGVQFCYWRFLIYAVTMKPNDIMPDCGFVIAIIGMSAARFGFACTWALIRMRSVAPSDNLLRAQILIFHAVQAQHDMLAIYLPAACVVRDPAAPVAFHP